MKKSVAAAAAYAEACSVADDGGVPDSPRMSRSDTVLSLSVCGVEGSGVAVVAVVAVVAAAADDDDADACGVADDGGVPDIPGM